MDPATPPPAFGSRTYTITDAGLALVEERHQFKPRQGETEPEILRRIIRLLGSPAQVEILYKQDRIVLAEARRIPQTP
jgi:hypothetical protein